MKILKPKALLSIVCLGILLATGIVYKNLGGKPAHRRTSYIAQEAAAFGSYNPTGGNLAVGSAQPINSNTTGVNTGGWQALLSSDNYYWDATSTASGFSQEVFIDGVELNNANKFAIVIEADTDNTTLNRFYQICDWVSSTTVDNPASDSCATGGWRTLNTRRAAITTATETAFTFHIYNGRWNTAPTSSSNTPLDTPLSNFIRNSDGRVLLRAFSSTNCATCRHRLDYVNLQAVIDPVYMPAGAVLQSGTTATTYQNIINGVLSGQSASDNAYLSVAGSATQTVDISIPFPDVRLFPGANSVLIRAEYSCTATGPTHRPKIWNYATTTPQWEYFSSTDIPCGTTDATNALVKNNIRVSDYLSPTSTMLIGWETLATTTASVRLDMLYAMVLSVNTDSAQCEISFGSGAAGDCQNTRDLDTRFASTTGPAIGGNVWYVSSTQESSAQAFDFYGQDNDGDTTGGEQAVSANLWIPMSTPTGTSAGRIVGVAHAFNFRAGLTGLTIAGQIWDDSGGAAAGGWRTIGTTNNSPTAFTYQDSITNGYSVNSPSDNLDTYNVRTNVRIRTSASTATSTIGTAAIDFIGVAPRWVERSPAIPTIRQQYTPSGGQLIEGTEQPINGAQTNSGNVGSWRGTLASDNFRWDVSSTASGLNQQVWMDGVELNGANKLIIVIEHSASNAGLARWYQICDWISSSSVDNAADSQCTGGGWRNLNIRDAAITATTEATYTWHIYNGYWEAKSATNTPVQTPLNNFINTASSSRVLIRAYSTSTAVYTHSLDYVRLDAVVDPVYMPASVTITSGYATTSYRNILNGPLTGQSASDDARFAVAGNGTNAPDFYFTMGNVRTYPGANAVLLRAEYSCSATGFNHRPKIWNFTTASWEGFASNTIPCNTTDATNAWARNLDLSSYVVGNTMRIGWDTTIATTTASVRLDQLYVIIGSVNNDSAQCEISFGNGTAGDCVNTRELDTTLASTSLTAPAATWQVNTIPESTAMATAYYPFDNDNDTTGNEYAASANLWFPLQPPSSTGGMATALLYSLNFRSGTSSQTIQAGMRDFLGSNATAVGGWTALGATNAATSFTYQDSLTNGYFANTTYQYIDTYNGRVNMRIRTTVASTTSVTRDYDFAMVSLQWTDTKPEVNSAPSAGNFVVNGGNNIVLLPNTTTSVTVSYQVTDNDGCQDVFTAGSYSVKLFRSSSTSSCAPNNQSCYEAVSTVNDCSAGNSANVTSTFNLWYFADATDASSSFPAQDWRFAISLTDGSNNTFSTTTTGVELNTLVAIEPASSSYSYPPVSVGGDTGSNNIEIQLYNVGNASMTISISGTALVNGGNSIPTSSQRFSSGTFTYGSGGVPLSDTPQSAISFPIFSGPPYAYKPWATTTPLPYTDSYHTSLVHNGFIYTIGGNANSSATSTVIYAPINSNGTLGAWVTTTPLPYTNYEHTSLVHNGFIYTIGGNANGSITSTVIYAPINSNGTLGAWVTTTPLPYTGRGHTSLIYNGFIYIIGGDANGFSTSTVIYAPINSNGTLGAWVTTTPMLYDDISPTSFIHNGFVYAIGGTTAGFGTSTVIYAPINSNGTLGAWATTTPLPYIDVYHTSLIYNGFIYTIGGAGGGSTVLYAAFPARSTFWGVGVPGGVAVGNYTGTITYTAAYSP